jgi:hypothetical protein
MKESETVSFNNYLVQFNLDFAKNEQHGIRYGQQMFNTLHSIKPELANHIRGTELDPFHKEISPDVFDIFEYLEKHWEEY